MSSAVDYGLQLYFIVTKIVTSLLWGVVVDGPPDSREEPLVSGVRGRPVGGNSRLHAAYSCPNNTPPSSTREPPIRAGQRSAYPSHQCASTGWTSLRFLSPPLLAWLTTEAVRTKNPEIQLGATPNDLARKLGLSTTSGPRGTARRLEDQLNRLLAIRLDWQTSMGLAPSSSGSAFVAAGGAAWFKPLRRLLPGQPTWRSHIELGQHFFQEITRSAVPVDLRAIHQLQRSPLAIDLYVWLTYRMSYLKKPTLVPWEGLQNQFGSGYSRPRDFRCKALAHLQNALRIYPAVRIRKTYAGLWLFPSPPHVQARSYR